MLITNAKPLPNVLSILNPHTVTIAFANGQLPLIQRSMAKERNQKDLPVLNGKMAARLLNSEMSTPHSKVCHFTFPVTFSITWSNRTKLKRYSR